MYLESILNFIRYEHCALILGGFHNFYVTCIDFGEQELTLRVGNNKTTTNQFPAIAEASIRLVDIQLVNISQKFHVRQQ
jgi:hypothetical protein